ncbi:DUF1007 family protein [Spirochaeta africana]|uniref:ABC-type uncharacterized transport system, periplasmic component n=1 Tax=Spirochaeta africana (strain ATCC 700263 / DSM 8902 / Z-7692) TaxID=889378 RepID=H9UM26_SPIAZ|nr:DUF1007 family protein [Spirochaeta africana]AFG38569.1 ABC-type uncharacterized transport system, periplasmic component [Spirochaeta africana DSM 8902]
MRRLLCLSAVLAGITLNISAHPHVFISARAEVEFTDDVPTAVHTRWEFDDFFSRMILLDFAGGSSSLNSRQIADIRSGAFDNLSHYNYFLHILVDGQEVPITEVRDFHAEVDGRTLVYSFRVPLPQPDGPDAAVLRGVREIVVGVYDDSYYSYFDYPQQPVSFRGDVPAGTRSETRERPDRRYYFNLIVPEMFHIRWD